MGNCIKKQSSIQAHDDDSPSSSPAASGSRFSGKNFYEHHNYNEGSIKKKMIEEKEADNVNEVINKGTTTTNVREVKIKISKKQLEELLGRTNVQGLSVQEVLAHLINVSDTFEPHQRSWRPALPTVPELNEDLVS